MLKLDWNCLYSGKQLILTYPAFTVSGSVWVSIIIIMNLTRENNQAGEVGDTIISTYSFGEDYDGVYFSFNAGDRLTILDVEYDDDEEPRYCVFEHERSSYWINAEDIETIFSIDYKDKTSHLHKSLKEVADINLINV